MGGTDAPGSRLRFEEVTRQRITLVAMRFLRTIVLVPGIFRYALTCALSRERAVRIRLAHAALSTTPRGVVGADPSSVPRLTRSSGPVLRSLATLPIFGGFC